MEARDEVIEIITRDRESSGGDGTWAVDLVEAIEREHAHGLAEKIRNSEVLRDLTDDHMADCNAAADLIDPEVNP